MIQRLALLVPFLLLGCRHSVGTGHSVTGSGTKATVTRALGSFDSIQATGAFRLEVRADAPTSGVTIDGDDNIVPLFETKVSGGKLELHLPSGSFSLKEPLVVRVDAPGLAGVETSGAIDTDIRGIALDFQAQCSGASKLRAQGTTNSAKFQTSGAIDLEAFDLVARRVEVAAAGASNARVHATELLEVDASGACTVRYRGQPKVDASTSGSSTVRPDQ